MAAYSCFPHFDMSLTPLLNAFRSECIMHLLAWPFTCVQAALATPNVAKYSDGKTVKKVIFVPSKILNLILG